MQEFNHLAYLGLLGKEKAEVGHDLDYRDQMLMDQVIVHLCRRLRVHGQGTMMCGVNCVAQTESVLNVIKTERRAEDKPMLQSWPGPLFEAAGSKLPEGYPIRYGQAPETCKTKRKMAAIIMENLGRNQGFLP